MSKHTPGPWTGNYPARKVSNHGDWQGKVMATDSVGLLTVATVNSGNGPDNTREVCEANARLIAAAPETAAERDRLKAINAELLEALRAFLAYSEQTADTSCKCVEVEDAARAAIAKAEED